MVFAMYMPMQHILYHIGFKSFSISLLALMFGIFGVQSAKGMSGIFEDTPDDAFVLIWEVTGENKTIELPLPQDSKQGAYLYDFTVDYNDPYGPGPVVVDAFNSPNAQHTYLKRGTYEIRITKNTTHKGLPAWSFLKAQKSCAGLIGVDSLGRVGMRNLNGAFAGCQDLKYVAGGNTSQVIDMGFMFSGADALTHVAVADLDFSSLETAQAMFAGTRSLKCLDMRGLNFPSLKPGQQAFQGLFAHSGVENISFEGSQLSKLDSLHGLFSGAAALSEVSFRGTDLSHVSSVHAMFTGNPKLKHIDFREVTLWNQNTVSDPWKEMFRGVPLTAKLYCPDPSVRKIHDKTCEMNLVPASSQSYGVAECLDADITSPEEDLPIVVPITIGPPLGGPDIIFQRFPSLTLALEADGATVIDGALTIEPNQEVAIGGTCSPDGVGSIEIIVHSQANAALTCDCDNGRISNCKDPMGTPTSALTFANTDMVIAMLVGEPSVTDQQLVNVRKLPSIDLVLEAQGASIIDGDLVVDHLQEVTIGGTCSPDGVGSIEIFAFSQIFGSLRCDCDNGRISNCKDLSDTPIDTLTFPASGMVIATLFDEQGNETDQQFVEVNPPAVEEVIKFCPAFTSGNGDGMSGVNAGASCRAILEDYKAENNGTLPPDGAYFIKPDGPTGNLLPFKIYCDMTTDGGGWTLVNKSEFTTRGPSIIEMTGDKSLEELSSRDNGTSVDPWGGGNIHTMFTDLDEFTDPSTNSNAPGYQGDKLTDITNGYTTDEKYAILERSAIHDLRTNCYGGVPDDSVMRQRSANGVRYVQTSKRFNPIQHICADNHGGTYCSGEDPSGCHPEFILELFANYDLLGHRATTPLVMYDLKASCSSLYHGGISEPDFQYLSPAGWAAGDPMNADQNSTSFYDLSAAGRGTSGSIIGINDRQIFGIASCSTREDCPNTTVWVK